MDAKEYLRGEARRLADESQRIIRKSEDENRSMTPEETAAVKANQAQISDYKSRIQEMQDREDLKKAIEGSLLPASEPSKGPEDAKTIGEAFVRSPGYKALVANGFRGTRWSSGPVEIGAKLTDAGLNVVSTGDAGGNLPLQPQVTPIVSPVENPLVFAGLFGSGVATQNTIVYLEETTTTPGALSERYSDSDASVTLTAEGAAKSAAFVNFTKRSTSLEKIAAFLPVSDEMLEDEPAIVSYINGRLALFIRQAEDAHLLDELLAANIAEADGSVDLGGDNWFDAIAAGILEVQLGGGLNPDAVVMNPSDFWTMSTTKAGASGEYFGGSPYSAASRTPWGVPVVVTNGLFKGTALVGAFREGATVWRKGGITVEASNSHEDYFRKNLTAIRVEERLALTVYRPGAFCKATQ